MTDGGMPTSLPDSLTEMPSLAASDVAIEHWTVSNGSISPAFTKLRPETDTSTPTSLAGSIMQVLTSSVPVSAASDAALEDRTVHDVPPR